MAITYKAFFKYDSRGWIPIDAIEDRTHSIPSYIRIDSPGRIDLHQTLEEARQRQRLGIRVSKATIYSMIGREALDGLNLRHQYNQSINMSFVVEKYTNGKMVESIILRDYAASQGSAPGVYDNGLYWGKVIDLKLPSAVLARDVPKR